MPNLAHIALLVLAPLTQTKITCIYDKSFVSKILNLYLHVSNCSKVTIHLGLRTRRQCEYICLQGIFIVTQTWFLNT